MRSVFATMGTIASLESTAAAAVVARVEETFASYEARFSLYLPDSELSCLGDGGDLTAAGAAIREMYADALAWRDATAGAFTPHRPDGRIDLDGIVKARAMSDAGSLLETGDWCLNVGGDIVTGGREWSAGIVDPHDRDRMLGSVELSPARPAMATSGSAERGDHIWTRGRAPAEFVQVTVIASDIVTADVLATAIVSGGRESLDDLCDRFDVDVLAVFRSRELLATPGMTELLLRDA